MSETVMIPAKLPTLEEIQQGWQELGFRVRQLEAEKCALEGENKALRLRLESVIEHRLKSHSELIVLLTTLVSKLPINDVGVIISKLVEHQVGVSQFLGTLGSNTTEAALPVPMILKTLDQTRRDLGEAIKPVVEELIALDSPLERETLQAFVAEPELFFSPRIVRANRCFVKGLVPKERIVRDFGPGALVFFNDLTTDPKLNPNPKPEEIVLAFKPDFEALLGQNSGAIGDKKADLLRLYQQVQRSKGSTDEARAQKNGFARLSFLIELLHYYEHQNTEAPDVIFAQRLPALVEQLVLGGSAEKLDGQLIGQVESLIAFVINPDHRLMIVNNVGKGGGLAKTLKYILKLRAEKVPDFHHAMVEFVKHLVTAGEKPPTPQDLAAILRLLKTDTQLSAVRAIMVSDRMRKADAEALGKAVGAELGLKDLAAQLKAPELPPDVDRQMAWSRIKDLINGHNDPKTIAAAIRERLHAKYDADEIKQSWVALIEADAISLIRIFCQLPYLPSGKTDPIAQTVMETYATRLTHEKYASAYNKVTNSLKNMFKAKPDSPTLLNFVALVRWVNPEAADKLCADVGMHSHG